MFGRFGAAIAPTSITFTPESALSADVPRMLGLKKLVAPARNCRRIGKKDMIHNSATPHIELGSETYEVRVDGTLITCEPSRDLPLAQRYFLF